MLIESDNKAKERDPKTLAHFLSSALRLEEQFRNSVYRDYLDHTDWPIDLRPEVFEEIQKRISILIEDSSEHEQTIQGLSRKYRGNRNRSKDKIVKEFELMEGFEISARDFYSRISSDRQLGDEHLRETFRNLAQAEQHHAQIVREIIDLVKNSSTKE